MTIHFRRIAKGTPYPAEPGGWKARYYRDGQKFVATFPRPVDEPEIRAALAELQVKANELGVAVQYLVCDHWLNVEPQAAARYAFVVRWPDGREPELATRNGRLIVSPDKTVLCPPYEPVVFSGDPAWTVPVVDEPVPERPSADESPESHRAEPDNPKET